MKKKRHTMTSKHRVNARMSVPAKYRSMNPSPALAIKKAEKVYVNKIREYAEGERRPQTPIADALNRESKGIDKANFVRRAFKRRVHSPGGYIGLHPEHPREMTRKKGD